MQTLRTINIFTTTQRRWDSAQKPALMKSLKTLVNELERLHKSEESEEFENLTPDDLLNKDVIQRIAKKRANSNPKEKATLDSYVEVAMQKALLNTFHDPQYPEKLDMAWSNFPSSPVGMELRTSPRNWLTKAPDGQYDVDTEKFAEAPITFSALNHIKDMSPENADKIIKKVAQSDASMASKDAIFRNLGKFASLETLLNKQIVPAGVSYDVIKDKTKDFTEHPIPLEKLKELYDTHHAKNTSYVGRRLKDYVLSHPDTPKEEILDNIKNEANVSRDVLTHKALSPEDVKHAVKLRILNNRGFLTNQSFIGLNTKEKVDKGLAALDGLHDYVKGDPDSGSHLKDYGAHLISMARKDPDDVREYAFHKLLERYKNKDYLSNDPNTAAAIKANLAHSITGLVDIDTPSSQKLLKEIAKGAHSAKDKTGKVKENDLLESVLNRYRFHGINQYKDFVNEMRKNVIESGHLPSVVNLYKKWGSAEHSDHQKTELDHIINKYGIEKAAKIIPHMGDGFLKRDVFSNPELSQKIMPHLSPAAKAKLQKDGVFPGGISKHDSPLKFSSNTEILRKLRDVAEANGGSISAKQLAQHGLNENALKVTHLKDAKGNYTKEAIQNHIDSMPKHTYDYSHTRWDRGQMHSDEKQYVFQLNHNDNILKEMQDAGVYDTFAKAHELSFNSKHPVKKNTLGWVRYTKGKDGNIHIDEVQSDLGRSLHGSIKEYLENKPDSPQKRKMQELFSKEKIDKMNDILFKGQHPSKILHEGFLQFLRDNGNVGKDVHIWQAMPKAKLARQRTQIELHEIQADDFIKNHKKIENNQELEWQSHGGIRYVASNLLGDDEESSLFKKHIKPYTYSNLEELAADRQNYVNELVNSRPYQLTLNHLKAHQTGDALESALEHPNIKDKLIVVPYTLNELPVHMKVGYHETPIKMGYEADSYGKIETQKNTGLANQPTWKQPLRKSLKALTAEYEYLQKQLNSAKNMTKSIAGDSHEKSTNEPRRNEEVGSGPRLGEADRGGGADMARPRTVLSSGGRQENAGKPTAQRPRSSERFMGKSEALAGEFKKLLKAVLKYGVWVPDHVDAAHKKQHPEKKRYVGHYGKNGEPTWTYDSAQSNLYDNNLKMLLNNQQITKDGKTYLPNNLNTLKKENIDLLSDYVKNNLMKDPDRHVIAANTDPNKPKDHMEVRVRHLINALTGSEGYEIKDVPTGGFEIYAPRHSQSVKTKDIATRWTFHPTKKRFKSERIYPISDEGGKTDDNPTEQSQYGRDGNRRLGKTDRRSGANESGQSKPSHHDVGKSLSMGEVTEKNFQLLKAEDEAGMTAYSLRDGYSLHHETSQNGYDIWAIGHGGQRAGTFMICTDETRRGRPFVSWAGVDKPHRGKGIGAAVYKTLAAHYGGLDSDRGSTSADAIKAWRRAGGKQLKIKTQFGDFRYTLGGDKKRPPIVWNEDLEKAAHPNELRKLKNKTDPKAPDLVDTAAHSQQSADPNYINFLNHPKVQRGLTNIEGISAKMVHKVGDDTFMAKPYHKKVESATKRMNPLPISGWSTMATRNLFHAAGIGHLCEDVSFHEHNGTPMTVHKFAHDAKDITSPIFQHIRNPDTEAQARKIAVMDFLTNNLDRHGGNVMFHSPDGNKFSLLAIDHERGFQYNKGFCGAETHDARFERPSNYFRSSWGLRHAARAPSWVNEEEFMPEGETTKDWWRANKDNVLNSFNKDIESIKDPHVKNHIKMNFMERWNWMNEHSHPDHYDLFDNKAQPARILKERRPKTDYKAIIKNLPQAPHEAIRAIDSLFGQKLSPSTKETLVDLWNEQIGKMSGQEIGDYHDHIVNTSKHPHPKGAYCSLMNGLIEKNNRQGMLHLVQNNKINLPYWKEKFEEALKKP